MGTVATWITALATVAMVWVGWRNYELYQQAQQQQEQHKDDLNDLLEAVVIATLLTQEPGGTGAFDRLTTKFREHYKGKRPVFKAP